MFGMGLGVRALTKYRRDGFVPLLTSGVRFARKALVKTYWDVSRKRTFEIADTSATFESTASSGGDGLRYRLKTERDALRDFVTELRPDDVVWDVGAHIGTYTVFAANKVADGDGAVVAFEPHPPNLQQLRTNLELNEGRPILRNVALSDERGDVKFDGDDGITGDSSFAPTGSENTYTVRTERGDEIAKEEPLPTIVKIDVEGAEGLVIDGLKQTLSSRTRVVYVEVHFPVSQRPSIEDFGYSYKDIERTLTECGYEIRTINRRVGEMLIKGVRNDARGRADEMEGRVTPATEDGP